MHKFTDYINPQWHVIVDFETYYNTEEQCSVSTQGVRNYVRDSYAYMVAIVAFQDPKKLNASTVPDFQWVGTLEELENVQFPFDLSTAQPWAANANFDQAWWEKYFPAFDRDWLCLLDLGAHYQLPGDLARLSKAVLEQSLIDKKLRGEMDGVHYRDLSPEKQKAMLSYCLTDSLVEARVLAKILVDYPELYKLEPEIRTSLQAGMTPIEYRLAAHTRMTNRRGIQVDTPKLLADIQTLAKALHDATIQIPWHANIDPKTKKTVKLLSMAQLHRWCQANEIPAPESRAKGNEELDDLMSDHPKLAEIIGHMRVVNSVNALLEKAREVEARTDENGEMPLELIYCGARHTRRWSSRGVNMQNLHQFPVALNAADAAELEELKKVHGDQAWKYFNKGVWSRRWFIPRKGKKFLILDFSQIEPRCLAWLTDNQAMLSSIRAGFNIYEAHARATMGYTDPDPLKKKEPRKYKLAKIRVLQLGYGSGAAKFLTAARKEGLYEVFEVEAEQMLATGLYFDPETKELMTLEQLIHRIAQTNVQDFRRESPKVTEFWGLMDEALMAAARDRGEHHLEIEMPTGEKLRYLYVRRTKKVDPVTQEEKWSWMCLSTKNDASSGIYNLWGGVCVQGSTQRMARDVLGSKIPILEDAGFPVIFHSHDELILEADADIAEQELLRAMGIMRISPPWAPDLPLDVSGSIEDHYVK